jgi:hypothetical protein
MPSKFGVYTHSITGRGIFYVGKGSRYRAGKVSRFRNQHYANVVCHYGGSSQVVVEFFECNGEAASLFMERILVAGFRACGIDLTNMTDGGEGNSGYKTPEDVKQKMSRSCKKAYSSKELREKVSEAVKRSFTPESRLKISVANKGKIVSQETRKKLSEANKRRPPISDASKAKHALAMTGKKATEETKRKMSEAQLRRWARERNKGE